MLSDIGAEVAVGITYKVTEASSAVQFLTPEQTACKEHPFLFTQCQAIHARAFCPCQVRFYESLSATLSFVPISDP